ncbi:MAG: hypothetical protein IK144_12880 [Bacteroidaceae bacterium]|nr:hypothetical protein [Bacteroidaceae bacterium]
MMTTGYKSGYVTLQSSNPSTALSWPIESLQTLTSFISNDNGKVWVYFGREEQPRRQLHHESHRYH